MKSIAAAFVLALLVFASAYAAPVPTINLIPSGGTVAGLPGTVVGWGYDITNSDPSDWVLLNDSYVDGSLATGTYGTYVDYISADPNLIVIDPGSDSGPVPFSPGVSGVGEFDIDEFVPPLAITGDINIDYSVFSEDPNSPSFDPSSFVTSGTLTAPAQVDVVPEPASALLLGAALLPLAFRRPRR